MFNKISLGIFTLLLILAASGEKNMTNTILDITVNCRDNQKCLFNGRDMFLDISISNIYDTEIELPLEYLQKKGPSIIVIDTYTQSELYLKTNLADPELMENFVKILPGDSVTMEWVIFSYELKQFSNNKDIKRIDLPYVNVVAKISVKTDLLVKGKKVDFLGTDTINIVSAKTLRQVLATPDHD